MRAGLVAGAWSVLLLAGCGSGPEPAAPPLRPVKPPPGVFRPPAAPPPAEAPAPVKPFRLDPAFLARLRGEASGAKAASPRPRGSAKLPRLQASPRPAKPAPPSRRPAPAAGRRGKAPPPERPVLPAKAGAARVPVEAPPRAARKPAVQVEAPPPAPSPPRKKEPPPTKPEEPPAAPAAPPPDAAKEAEPPPGPSPEEKGPPPAAESVPVPKVEVASRPAAVPPRARSVPAPAGGFPLWGWAAAAVFLAGGAAGCRLWRRRRLQGVLMELVQARWLGPVPVRELTAFLAAYRELTARVRGIETVLREEVFEPEERERLKEALQRAEHRRRVGAAELRRLAGEGTGGSRTVRLHAVRVSLLSAMDDLMRVFRALHRMRLARAGELDEG